MKRTIITLSTLLITTVSFVALAQAGQSRNYRESERELVYINLMNQGQSAIRECYSNADVAACEKASRIKADMAFQCDKNNRFACTVIRALNSFTTTEALLQIGR